MDPELKKLVEENLALTQENNKMLHLIRRSQERAKWFRIFYWGVIIALSLGSYYLIAPSLGKLTAIYGGGGIDALDKLSNSANSLPDVNHLKDLINTVK